MAARTLLLCFVASFFATAARAQVQIRNPDTFVYAITGDIDSLDPDWEYDSVSHTAMWQIYETLVFYKGSSTSEFEPLLASIVPSDDNGLISSDHLTYTFPIRKGVKFHDGRPMTPEDAKYSVLRFLLTDRAGGPSNLLLQPILGVSSTRDENGKPLPDLFAQADQAVEVQGSALVIHLQAPYPAFLSILASFCPILSKSWVIAHGGWDGREETWAAFNNPAKESSYLYDQANGTGPFMLERWDKKQKQLSLLRNVNYWRQPAQIKRLVFKTVDDFATRRLMLAAGDADAAMVEREYLPQVAGLAGVKVEDDLPLLEVHNAFIFTFKANPLGNPYIGSGKLDGDGIPPDFFSDIEVRRGFAQAFDYDSYIRDGYRGKGSRARGPIPAGVFGYNSLQALIPYDLQAAADHFRKAFSGDVWRNGFVLTVAYMQGRGDRQLACEILKKGVESINPKFRVNIRGIQWSNYLDAYITKKLPIVNGRWTLDYPDPNNSVYPFMDSQGYYAKVGGYNSPRVDRLIDQAAVEVDPDKRKSMYRDLQMAAYEDVPDIFTLDTYNFRVYQTWVKGWDYNPVIINGYFYPVSKG